MRLSNRLPRLRLKCRLHEPGLVPPCLAVAARTPHPWMTTTVAAPLRAVIVLDEMVTITVIAVPVVIITMSVPEVTGLLLGALSMTTLPLAGATTTPIVETTRHHQTPMAAGRTIDLPEIFPPETPGTLARGIRPATTIAAAATGKSTFYSIPFL
jgi:hypothetical protein